MQKASKGFTLIELMLVVAIISIVVLVVVISLMRSRTESKIAAFKSQVHSMQVLAVSKCDGEVLNAVNVISPVSDKSYVGAVVFGSNSTSYTNNNGLGQNCGAPGVGSGLFNFTVSSISIAPACTAIVRDTGVNVSCP